MATRRRKPRATRGANRGRTAALTPLPVGLKALVRAKADLHDALAAYTRHYTGGKRTVYALLLASVTDEDAQAIASKWHDLAYRHGTFGTVWAVDLMELVTELEMEPAEFVGVVERCGFRYGIDGGRRKFAEYYPELMESSLKKAIMGDNVARERMHFEAAGHVPTAKGIQIGIQNVTRQEGVVDQPGAVPRIEHTVRQVVRDLNE